MRLGWAPDGSLISIVAVGPDERPGEAVVYVVDPRTGAATQVSDSPRPWREDDAAPSWSPDSSRLLYAIDRSDARAASGIALAERRRGGWTERIVVPNPLSAAALWLDSDHFVFLHAGTRLVVANADGSGQRELVRVEVPLRTSPCVAPDGSRVALALAPPPDPGGAVEGRELLVVAVDATTPPRRIPTGRIYPTGPGCSWQAVHP
jgi:Tol biopolymer transport system component